MRTTSLKFFLFLLILLTSTSSTSFAKKKSNKNNIETIDDHKDFKKILRTKNNILIGYFSSNPESNPIYKTLKEVSEAIWGKGSILSVDCTTPNGKKLCKKLKINPSKYILKHYKDGDFNKDYDRAEKVSSLINFMKDPTGEIPWHEDETAQDVVHLLDPSNFNKFFKKEKGRVIVMFYAPWCGFCKRLKPTYAEAASEAKEQGYTLAAIDVNEPQNGGISRKYNITGFPTLLFFEQGVAQYPYPGENNKKGFLDFLANPSPEEKEDDKPKEAEWKDEQDSEVVHLTDDNFDTYLSESSSVNVMFYAPWCGHCKKLKPQFSSAAKTMKADGIHGKLVAVDCTKETKTCKKFNVNGYPTLKYFKDGELAYDSGHARDENEIIKFMKNPQEPPPPPPPEKLWADEESEVRFLTEVTFKPFLKGKKHVLVMFYAPWCGHCKKAKPEIQAAAEEFKDNPKVEFAAVDCTQETSVCSAYEVSGYPTFKYFKYFNQEKARSYDGGRTKKDFVKFMMNPDDPRAGQIPTSEEEWEDLEGSKYVTHLTNSNFESILSKKSGALVMFYAPWCGHCKAMKADYALAAKELAMYHDKFVFSALDATVETKVGSKFDIKGFPTLKYFENGKMVHEYQGGRKKSDLVSFLANKIKNHKLVENSHLPENDPWENLIGSQFVQKLTDTNFESMIENKPGVLVIFYDGSDNDGEKILTREFALAAQELNNYQDKFLFASLDGNKNKQISSKFNLKKYPLLKYFTLGIVTDELKDSVTRREIVKFMAEKIKTYNKDEL